MKTLMIHTILVLTVILSTITCEKGEQITDIPDGIYEGILTHIHIGATDTAMDTVRITFNGHDYQIAGKDPLNFGYGSWEMERGKIRFSDQMLRNTKHNWHWVLNGDYHPSMEKSKLHLIKENENCRLHYILERK